MPIIFYPNINVLIVKYFLEAYIYEGGYIKFNKSIQNLVLLSLGHDFKGSISFKDHFNRKCAFNL